MRSWSCRVHAVSQPWSSWACRDLGRAAWQQGCVPAEQIMPLPLKQWINVHLNFSKQCAAQISCYCKSRWFYWHQRSSADLHELNVWSNAGDQDYFCLIEITHRRKLFTQYVIGFQLYKIKKLRLWLGGGIHYCRWTTHNIFCFKHRSIIVNIA